MKKIIFTLMIVCLFITPVSAYQMALTGSDEIDKSLDVLLEITNYKEYDGFYGLTADLNYDKEKLELLEITGNNNFKLTYSAKTKRIVLYNSTSVNEKTGIINLKFKNIGLNEDEETEINIDNIVATDSKKDIKVDKVTKKIKATSVGKESNSAITEITINGNKIDFDSDELSYDIVVSNDTTKIDVKANVSGNGIVTGEGEYELVQGNNEIKITIKDEDKIEKTYVVNVNRENSNSNINEEDLFIKSKKNRWNKIYFIPVGVILLIIITLILKRKGVK